MAEQWTNVGDELPAYGEVVQVRVYDMTFLASLECDASMTTDEVTCDQWHATNEGEHPPCWSEGACWDSNMDECESLPVSEWRPVPEGWRKAWRNG